MFKTIAAITFAAVIFDISIGAPRATMIEASLPQRSLKSDRLMLRQNEPACIDAAWPNYDSYCLRGSQSGDRPRKVRIVSIDRLHPKISSASSAN